MTDDSRPVATDPAVAQFAAHSVVNILAGGASGLASLAIVVLVARARGPAGAGAFFVAMAAFTILSNACELGADTGLLRSIPHDLASDDPTRIAWTLRIALVPPMVFTCMTAIALALAAAPISDIVASGAEHHEVASILRAVVLFLPFSVAATILLAATRAFGTMAPTVRIDRLLRPACQCLLVAGAAGRGGYLLGVAFGAPFVVAAVLAWIAVRRAVDEHGVRGAPPDATKRTALAVEFWSFAAPRALSAFAQIGVDKIDVLMVGALASTAAAGVYSAATRFAIAGLIGATAVMQAMQPVLTRRLVQRDFDGASRLCQAATAWTVLVSWPVYGSLAFLAGVVLRVFGHGFAGGADALVIVSIGMMVGTGIGPAEVTLLMAGGSRRALANTSAALAVNIALNIVLIPRLGIAGAAWAWAISIAITNAAAVVQVKALLGFHSFSSLWARAALTVLGCFALGAAVTEAVRPSGLGRIAVFASVGLPAYALAVWCQRRALQLSTLRASGQNVT